MKKMLCGMVFLGLIACDPSTTGPDGNDVFPTTGGTSGGGTTAGGTTGTTAAGTTGMETTGSTGVNNGGTTSNGTPTTGGTTGAQTGVSTGTTAPTTGGVDGGTTGVADAGTTGPTQSVIPGTAANCNSFTEPSGDMCSGWFCSVTAQDIAAELVPGAGPCSDLDPVDICGGALTGQVAQCARDAATANPIAGLLGDFESLRPDVQACVYEHPENSDLGEECLTCFLDVAVCAGENCFDTCLSGDSPECDACRQENQCDQSVFPCAGFPNPFGA